MLDIKAILDVVDTRIILSVLGIILTVVFFVLLGLAISKYKKTKAAAQASVQYPLPPPPPMAEESEPATAVVRERAVAKKVQKKKVIKKKAKRTAKKGKSGDFYVNTLKRLKQIRKSLK